MGPVIRERQLHRILGYVETGIREGARLVAGGRRLEALGPRYFAEPAVFAGVAAEMTIAREEMFGPVAAVIPFEDEAHAIELANRTLYGLAAGV